MAKATHGRCFVSSFKVLTWYVINAFIVYDVKFFRQNRFEFEHHTILNYSDPSIEDYLYASDKSLPQLDEMTEAPNATDFQINAQATPKSNIIILPTTPRAILYAAKPATPETNITYSAPQSYTSLTSLKPSPIGKPNTCSEIATCQVKQKNNPFKFCFL